MWITWSASAKKGGCLKTWRRLHDWSRTRTRKSGEKVSATFRFRYQARSWKFSRWVVARLEEDELGSDLRFVISSRYDDGFKLYYEQYCARGDMESRIKDQQLYLIADGISSVQ